MSWQPIKRINCSYSLFHQRDLMTKCYWTIFRLASSLKLVRFKPGRLGKKRLRYLCAMPSPTHMCWFLATRGNFSHGVIVVINFLDKYLLTSKSGTTFFNYSTCMLCVSLRGFLNDIKLLLFCPDKIVHSIKKTVFFILTKQASFFEKRLLTDYSTTFL